jgi:hypothetical protein
LVVRCGSLRGFEEETDAGSGQQSGKRGCEIEVPVDWHFGFPGVGVSQLLRRVGDHAALARCEIETFRYRVLHVAARITRNARQLRLRIDATWHWAQAITAAWQRIRTAFP